jgi:predicted amidophosphoribosyltransferase
MRNLAAQAYARVAKGSLWSALATTLQDLVVEIVEAAIELHGAQMTCTECESDLDQDERLCAPCWLKKHAETCHVCKSEIPMSQQRCTACVVELVRTELRANDVGDETIQAIIKILEAPL